VSDLIRYQTGNQASPTPVGFTEVTNPLHPAQRIASRLAHFPENYNLNAESHLSKLLKVLLGDSGVGSLHKRMMLTRLQSHLGSTHLFDLDAFYGSIFGAYRRSDEDILVDPMLEAQSPAQWDQTVIRDASYRSRVEQFAKAVNLGATKDGIEVAAEALLGVDVEVRESWIIDDLITNRWSSLDGINYSVLSENTYRQHESSAPLYSLSAIRTTGPIKNRHQIRIFPKRKLSLEERWDTARVLDRIKPAGSVVEIDDSGFDAYSDVRIASVVSDSEHWKIRTLISNSLIDGINLYDELSDSSGEYSEKPYTPWGEYQGEAWSYITNAPTAVAFTANSDFSDSERVDPSSSALTVQRSITASGTINFLPEYSLLPIQSLLSGRSVSEGVSASNPYSGLRNSSGSSTAPSVLIDGAKSSALSKVAPLKESINKLGARFWVTPDRDWWDTARDALEIRFANPEWVNYIDGYVSKFPSNFKVQAWDEIEGTWRTVLTRRIVDSNPSSVFSLPHEGESGEHSSYPEHWRRINIKISPVYTSHVRIVFSRFGEFVNGYPHITQITGTEYGVWKIEGSVHKVLVSMDENLSISALEDKYLSGGALVNPEAEKTRLKDFSRQICRPPKNRGGDNVAYSLAVKNVDIGFRLASLNDVPFSFTNLNAPVATVKNIAGQSVNHYIERYPAKNILSNAGTFWKCSPQISGNAIANLYLDVRDIDGNAQTVSAFDVDPITVGATVNIYYSNTEENIDFTNGVPDDSNIDPLFVHGNILPPLEGEPFTFPITDNAWIDVSNSGTQWNPTTQSWWSGVQFVAQADSTAFTDSTPWTAGTGYSSWLGEVGTAISSGSIIFRVNDVSASGSITFSEGDTVTFTTTCVVGSGSEISLTLRYSVNDGEATVVTSSGTSSLNLSPSFIRFGHSSNDDLLDAPFPATLNHFCLQYGTAPAEFLNTPSLWTRNVIGSDNFFDNDNPSSNILGSLIRLSGANVSDTSTFTRSSNKWGIVGGALNIFDQMSWTPIPRDYVVRRGILRIPSTPAQFFKMEFSSLNPEPFEPFLKINRRVKTMPSLGTAQPGTSGVEQTEQQKTALALSSRSRFSDTIFQSFGQSYSGVRLPTAGFSSDSLEVSADLRRNGGFAYNMVQWQPNPIAITNHQSGVHSYNVDTVPHENKVAFFVAIKSIKALRSDYSVPDNTSTYEDLYWDTRSVDESLTDMTHYSSGYYSTGSDPAPLLLTNSETVRGKVFESQQPVVAVQFATHQSDSVQVIEDDLFKNPELYEYDFDNTDSWHSVGNGFVYYDTDARCATVVRGGSTSSTILNGSSDTVETGSVTIGGIQSKLVPVSPSGMLSVACRVVCPKSLRSPLYIQIVGSDSSTVISEKEFTPTANSIWEETHQYILGAYPSLDQSVHVRVVQKESYQDSWQVFAISLFDDSCLWEFSNTSGDTWVPAYGIRNNQNGIIRFPTPGASLTYRFTAHRKNINLSYVKIKPWYQGRVLGKKSFPQRGPNMSIYDDQLPITSDPDFTTWTNPVPQSWFTRYERIFNVETETLFGNTRYLSAYRREAGETVSVADQSIVDSSQLIRSPQENVGVTDTSVRTAHYTRNASESITTSDESSFYLHTDGIATDPVEPV